VQGGSCIARKLQACLHGLFLPKARIWPSLSKFRGYLKSLAVQLPGDAASTLHTLLEWRMSSSPSLKFPLRGICEAHAMRRQDRTFPGVRLTTVSAARLEA